MVLLYEQFMLLKIKTTIISQCVSLALQGSIYVELILLHKEHLNLAWLTLTCIFISVINQLDAQNFCFTISLFHRGMK